MHSIHFFDFNPEQFINIVYGEPEILSALKPQVEPFPYPSGGRLFRTGALYIRRLLDKSKRL
jgi:hypothetical protein